MFRSQWGQQEDLLDLVQNQRHRILNLSALFYHGLLLNENTGFHSTQMLSVGAVLFTRQFVSHCSLRDAPALAPGLGVHASFLILVFTRVRIVAFS